MKAVLKVPNMKTTYDITNAKKAISSNEGVIACEINKEKGEINIVFDAYFTSEDELIQSLEHKGYIVL